MPDTSGITDFRSASYLGGRRAGNNSFTYSTWGQPTITTSHPNSANGNAAYGDLGFRFLYVGEFDVQWDDMLGLGLHYMHARHYSPALGRFLQPDPDRSEANPYAYATNNPITEIDPDGTCFILCVILVPLVIGAVIDTVSYAATSERPTLDGAFGEVAAGAVFSLLPTGKLSKAAKLFSAAGKIASKFAKARVAASRARAFLGSRASQQGQFRIPGGGPKSTKELREVISAWDKGSFPSRAASIRYHHQLHGQGQSIRRYTEEAQRLYRSKAGRSGQLGPIAGGRVGVHVRSGSQFGRYTMSGKIVTYGRGPLE